MSSSAARRRQKRAAEKKKLQKKVRHKRRFDSPEPPCTIKNTYGQAFLHRRGPLLIGSWAAPTAVETTIRASGKTPAKPVHGALLLDTGATNTCISLKAAQQLGLQPTRMQEGYGAGGIHRNPVFFAHLSIMIQDKEATKRTEMYWEQEVQGIPDLDLHARGLQVGGQDIEVVGLLGRDILRHTRLKYDGIDGILQITFDLKSLQGQPGR